MKNLVLTLLAMTALMMLSSFCEPEPPAKRTITVERTIFEDLTKSAEKGQLCCKAVASYESEIRNYQDSLTAKSDSLKVRNKELTTIKAEKKRLTWISFIALIILLAIIYLLVWHKPQSLYVIDKKGF